MAGRTREPGPTHTRAAENLRRIRQQRGLSYAELARRLTAIGHPIIDTGLLKIEKGERRVDVDDLVALSIALGVTPNRLLLPDVDSPATKFDLAPNVTQVRADDAWSWAYGERPLGSKPTSSSDESPAHDEVQFLAANRRYYAVGGFDWLAHAETWDERGRPADTVSDKVRGAATIAGAIIHAFTQLGLDTRDIRAAAESGIFSLLVPDSEPKENEKGLWQVVEWLMGHDDDATEADQ